MTFDNLKTLCPTGKSTPRKADRLDLMEFCTNIPRTTPLIGSGRLNDVDMDRWGRRALAVHFKAYHHLGRRATQLQMPPQWDRDGIFKIRNDGHH
eukprot:6168072-Heterocapsa_arctica.AAC.1